MSKSDAEPKPRAPDHVFGSFADLKLDERSPSPVVGHIRIGHPAEFLVKIRDQLGPLTLAPMIDESSLRGTIGLQFAIPAAVMNKIDFQQTIVCALLKFDLYDFKGGCVFSYPGGVQPLIDDWNAKRKIQKHGEHAAVFRVGKTKIYVDDLDLDGQVVISGSDQDFRLIHEYLKTELGSENSYRYGDLEIVSYLGEYLKAQGFVDKIIEEDRKTLRARRRRKQSTVFRLWRKYQQISRELILRNLTESARFYGYLRVDQVGLRLGMALIPREGTRFSRRSSTQANEALAVADETAKVNDLVDRLPKESIIVGSSLFDVGTIDPEIIKFAGQAIADLSGRTPVETQVLVNVISEAQKRIYGEPYAWAWIAHKPSIYALALVRNLRHEKEGRKEWLRLSQELDAKKILGPQNLDFLTWEFLPAHDRLQNIPVDRWVLAPGKSLLRSWKRELPRQTRKELLAKLGSFEFKLDRLELEDRVIYVSAPRFEKSLMTRMLRAHAGESTLQGDQGLTRVQELHSDQTGYIAIDVAALRQWLVSTETLGPSFSTIIGDLGRDFSDLHLSWQYHVDGKLTGQLVFSQGLIDQVRKIIDSRFSPVH